MTVAAACRADAPRPPHRRDQVEDGGRLRILPEAAGRPDEEPGSDQADGIDRFVAQLATFSQVEQTIKINTKLDQILQSTALRRPMR